MCAIRADRQFGTEKPRFRQAELPTYPGAWAVQRAHQFRARQIPVATNRNPASSNRDRASLDLGGGAILFEAL